MSRRRNHQSFAETSLPPELLHAAAFMEPPGAASRAAAAAAVAAATDGDFLELEPDEELLCSVSDITEHLGRNITVVLETALSEIRKMVSIRIRVLKLELREKTEEIEVLRARLEAVQRGGGEPPAAAEGTCYKKPDFGCSGTKQHNNNNNNNNNQADPRRSSKAVMPGVKKENIDAICDYLMKDKNSRGGCCSDLDPDQTSQTSSGGGGGGGGGEAAAAAAREARPGHQDHHQQDPHSLSLWSDSGMTAGSGSGPGSGHGDSESATDDLFSMLPSGSKRMYDYEWIAPMEYSSELKVMKDAECESALTAETDNDDEDDEDESSGRDGGGVGGGAGAGGGVGLQDQNQNQNQVPLSHVQAPEFNMEPQSSSAEGGSPLEGNADRPEAGPFPSHTYICSLCGTFCPDSLFLEEHIKLIHADSAGAQTLQALQSTSSAAPGIGDGCGGVGVGGADSRRSEGDQNEDGTGRSGIGIRLGGVTVKKEIKIEGGYECGDCGRHFNYLGNLRQHQRIHTGEKPFMCPECGERFRHAARLKSHRLVHSGAQSPFPCPQCGKGFSVLSGLKRHQRVHTGESPYACPQCGRRFKELGNLYTHQRIHSGATPYCCQQCGRSFRHLGTYKSHRCTLGQ